MTWRTVQYFVGSWRSRYRRALERLCCGPRDGERPPGTGIDPKFTYNPDLYAQPTGATLVKEFGLVESHPRRPAPRPVTDVKVTVPVNDLAVDEAKTALTGNGIEVVEVDRHRAMPAAFDKIAGLTVVWAAPDRLTDKNAVRPGRQGGADRPGRHRPRLRPGASAAPASTCSRPSRSADRRSTRRI